MQTQDASAHTPSSARLAVLDTQAVLDWLYFNDPITGHWETWRRGGHWHWVACLALRDELAHVLGRGHLPQAGGLPAEALLNCFDERATLLPASMPSLATGLRCTDPDDQKFIDFAVAQRASWLVSRDRAVLKLRRLAQSSQGLLIVPPAAWAPVSRPG